MTSPPTAARTNAEWLSDLRLPGPAREAALADLRAVLVSGLRLSLAKWLDTSDPEFPPLAEDFAQDALLKVLAHLDTFQGRSQFTTWAHKIAVHVALTELRRRRWKDVSLDQLLEERAYDGPASALAEAGPGPEAVAEQSDLLQHVRRIMEEELTPRQYRAMTAAALRGMPLEEVARRMGMKRNALYKLLHDARLRLKRRLARDGLTPSDLLAVFER